MSSIRHFPVVKNHARGKIIVFLQKQDPHTDWEAEFSRGHVRVDKHFVSPSYILSPGTTVIHDPKREIPEPPINPHYTVLYEDDYLIAINKPAPLPIHPTGTYFHHTLTKILAREGMFWYPIHRIDSETSGVLLLAKDPAYITRLSEALATGNKTYLIMVYGKAHHHFHVQMPLGAKEGSTVFKRQGFNPTGKNSHSEFRRIKVFKRSTPPTTITLLYARLHTGRNHQLRAHLAEKGFAVVGDKIYGKDESYFVRYVAHGMSAELRQELELSHQFLHCRSVTIVHPYNQKTVRITAPLSICPEISKFLEKLKREG